MTDLGTVLSVWAHPDDEAYLAAGLMMNARAAGHRVAVVTATRGEHGTPDPDTWPPERLAPLRERELATSLAVLDITEHHWLDHRDGTLATISDHHGATQIADLIDAVRPGLIVTFGPDGMTGHPDHRAISRWVTRAWHQTGRHPRLWYATVTPEFHSTWHTVNTTAGLWPNPADAPCTPTPDLAHTVHCAGPTLTRKYEALRAHHSQTAPLITLLGEPTYRSWWSTEYFVAAV
ncbi:PIG-L domain-containing protein [Acrocarpospora phusangensis]|uniref:PIG-L domain-containing protein n=2 Tax=Acrocarpospora phusangensis TaxID=1070424 RepID=A0A919UPJ4_9ACTN|nr:PIG-L domain-containing protein [Acrocarpospora phusangensis]